jgi:hypothetical protein
VKVSNQSDIFSDDGYNENDDSDNDTDEDEIDDEDEEDFENSIITDSFHQEDQTEEEDIKKKQIKLLTNSLPMFITEKQSINNKSISTSLSAKYQFKLFTLNSFLLENLEMNRKATNGNSNLIFGKSFKKCFRQLIQKTPSFKFMAEQNKKKLLQKENSQILESNNNNSDDDDSGFLSTPPTFSSASSTTNESICPTTLNDLENNTTQPKIEAETENTSTTKPVKIKKRNSLSRKEFILRFLDFNFFIMI